MVVSVITWGRMRVLPLLSVTIWAVGASTGLAAGAPSEVVELRGPTMGTTYSVKFWRPAGDAKADEVRSAIEALLERFDREMSTYRSDSELSRFKSAAPSEWFDVSPETATAVAHALEIHRLTGGASDVTIGPVLRLWRFGPGGGRNGSRATSPGAPELQSAMLRVGADRLHVRLDPPALRKDVDGLEVDLSSMAPGYAIDLIVEELANRRVDHCIVELGGEVRAQAPAPTELPGRWASKARQAATVSLLGLSP